MILKNIFLSWWINFFFDKTMINVTKHRGIKPVTGEKRRNYLVSEQNYQVTNFFSENVLALEMKQI